MDTSKKNFSISLFLLVILGLFFRLFQLSHQPYWMDEGYTINAVLSVNETGTTILDSGQPYSCPTYCYPTAYITHLFGDTAFSYRLLAAVAGTLFIVVIFCIVRRLFDTRIALLTTIFTTFSYWQITWSRQARWYTLFELFFWLAIFFFYQLLYATSDRRSKAQYLALTVLFTTLSILTHGLGYLLPFIFFGWYLVDELFVKKTFDLTKTVSYLTALLLGIATLTTIFHIELFSALIHKINLYYELPYYLSFYLRTYWLFIILALFALSTTDARYKKQMHYLGFIFLSYLLSLSFLTNIVHYRYLFHVTPVFFVLASVAAVSLAKHMHTSLHKSMFFGVLFLLFFATGFGVLVPSSTYYLESDNPETLGKRPHYAYTPQPDWNAAYAYIASHKTADNIIISSHPQFNKIFLGEPGYWIAYDYLGLTTTPSTVKDGREYYVGAQVIPDLSALKNIIAQKHGFIVFDFMAQDGKIPQEIIDYIRQNTTEVFSKKTNAFSQVWVYRF